MNLSKNYWRVNIHKRLHSNILSTHTSPTQYIRTRNCGAIKVHHKSFIQCSPRSRMRSPGLFQRQPSSCWCSVYWSRRSWNTTRMMLWNSEGFSFCKEFQGRCYCFRSKHINPGLSLQTLTYANTQCMSESYLHHFTSDFRKFPNFPIVKHSNFIGLACNDKIVIRCSSVESSSCIKLLTRIILSQVLWKETALSSFF